MTQAPAGATIFTTRERRKRSFASLLAAIAISLVWIIPVNFVRLDSVQALTYQAALGLALFVAVMAIGTGARYLVHVIAFLLIAGGIAFLLGRSFGPSIILLVQICAGYVLIRLRAGRIALPLLLASASVASLVLDWAFSQHLYVALFPSQYFGYFTEAGFRARGILGQPVPAAHLTISLLAYLYVLARPLAARQRLLLRFSIVAMGCAVVVTTGTRSAIVLIGALVVILVVETLKFDGPEALRRAPKAMFVGALLGIALMMSASQLATLRLFDFSSLPNSDSYEVRSGALSTVTGLSSDCAPCTVFGHGQGALAERLNGGAAISGIGTLDNMFLTAFWDYGLIGLGALVFLGCVALRKLSHGVSDINRAGAVGMLSLLVAFVFFDGVYISSGAFLLGLFLSSMDYGSRSSAGKRGAVHSKGSAVLGYSHSF